MPEKMVVYLWIFVRMMIDEHSMISKCWMITVQKKKQILGLNGYSRMNGKDIHHSLFGMIRNIM